MLPSPVLQVDVYGYPTAEKRFPEPMSPCGGLVATPAEMAKMLLWLVQPQGTGNSAGLLSETSIFAMQTIHFPIGKSVGMFRPPAHELLVCFSFWSCGWDGPLSEE